MECSCFCFLNKSHTIGVIKCLCFFSASPNVFGILHPEPVTLSQLDAGNQSSEAAVISCEIT